MFAKGHDLPHAPQYSNTLRLLGARVGRSGQKLKFQFGYMGHAGTKRPSVRTIGARVFEREAKLVFAALTNNWFAQPVCAPRIDRASIISGAETTEKTVMLTSQRLAISGTGAANGK